jgi:hypothetical protein
MLFSSSGITRGTDHSLESAAKPASASRRYTRFTLTGNRDGSAVARRIVPPIMRQFADNSLLLNPLDINHALVEAISILQRDRPYRSRFQFPKTQICALLSVSK